MLDEYLLNAQEAWKIAKANWRNPGIRDIYLKEVEEWNGKISKEKDSYQIGDEVLSWLGVFD